MTVSSLGLRVSTNSCLRWTKFDLERSRSRTRIRNNNHHNSKWCKWCCTTTTSTHWGIASQHCHILGWQSSRIDIQIFLTNGQCNQSYQFKVFAPAAPHWLGTSIGVLQKDQRSQGWHGMTMIGKSPLWLGWTTATFGVGHSAQTSPP